MCLYTSFPIFVSAFMFSKEQKVEKAEDKKREEKRREEERREARGEERKK